MGFIANVKPLFLTKGRNHRKQTKFKSMANQRNNKNLGYKTSSLQKINPFESDIFCHVMLKITYHI